MPCSMTGTAPLKNSFLARWLRYMACHLTMLLIAIHLLATSQKPAMPQENIHQQEQGPWSMLVHLHNNTFWLMRSVGRSAKALNHITELRRGLDGFGMFDYEQGQTAENLINVFVRMPRPQLAETCSRQDA